MGEIMKSLFYINGVEITRQNAITLLKGEKKLNRLVARAKRQYKKTGVNNFEFATHGGTLTICFIF